MSEITILCVTRAEPHALPFLTEMAELATDLHAPFVVAADGDEALRRLDGLEAEHVFTVRSHGYIESVLDQAIAECPDGYVLRLDDDERPSYGMYRWLLDRQYEEHDHWAFPRANLWPDEQHRLAGSTDGYPSGGTLWPDLQTRLSVKEKAGGRTVIHAGSPYGTGHIAPCVLEHHKFLVVNVNDRVEQARRYERIKPGAGTGAYLALQVPEVRDVGWVPYAAAVAA